MPVDTFDLATLIGTWVLVVGTLVFAYWQLRQAQRLHSSTTILELRERFFNDRMRLARKELSTWLLKDPPRGEETDEWEVGIFFELLGALTHRGVIDRRMVWSAFGTWVTGYYAFLKSPDDLIGQWRREAKDPLIFAEFEWLALQMLAIDGVRDLAHWDLRQAVADGRFIMESESRLKANAGGTLASE